MSLLRRLRDRWASWSFHDLPPAWTGLVASVLLAAVLGGVFLYGGAGGFTATYDVRAVFTDAANLRVGAPVEVAGVDVGSVTAVRGDFDRGHVVVDMAVERGVDLPDDVRAEIRTGGLFGGWVVRLSGIPGDALLADLPAGDRVVPLDRTSVAGGVVDALDAATTTFDELDTELVARVTDEVGRLLAGTRDTVPAVVDELDRLATVLEARTDDTASIAEQVQVVTAAIEDRQAEIDRLVAASTRLLDELTARRDQLADLLGRGDDRVRALTAFLDEHGEALELLAADVHRVVEVVEASTPEVNEALALLGPTFERLAAVRGDGPWIEFVSPSFGPFSTNDDDPLAPVSPLVSPPDGEPLP